MKLIILFLFIVSYTCISAMDFLTQEEFNRQNVLEAVHNNFKLYTGGASKLDNHFVNAADQRKQREKLNHHVSPTNEGQWKRQEDLQYLKDTIEGLDKISSYIGGMVGTTTNIPTIRFHRQKKFDAAHG